MKYATESLGEPIEIVESVESVEGVKGAEGIAVKWLSTVTREFSIEGMVFRPGDKFPLDATLVEIDGQWKIAGM